MDWRWMVATLVDLALLIVLSGIALEKIKRPASLGSPTIAWGKVDSNRFTAGLCAGAIGLVYFYSVFNLLSDRPLIPGVAISSSSVAGFLLAIIIIFILVSYWFSWGFSSYLLMVKVAEGKMWLRTELVDKLARYSASIVGLVLFLYFHHWILS